MTIKIIPSQRFIRESKKLKNKFTSLKDELINPFRNPYDSTNLMELHWGKTAIKYA